MRDSLKVPVAGPAAAIQMGRSVCGELEKTGDERRPAWRRVGINFEHDLAAPGGKVDHVDVYFNAGHPGVEKPHAHVVLWHVSKADETRVAAK